MRVAVLEDEPEWEEIIRHAIDRAGWSMQWFQDGETLVEQFRPADFDVIVADVVLKTHQARNGIDFVKALRARGITTPVLMTTLFADDYRSDTALYAGADDYVRKPFDQADLIARIHAVCRRMTVGDRSDIVLGDLRVSRHFGAAHFKGTKLELKGQGFAILAFLCERAGEVVSPAVLWAAVWPDQVRLGPQTQVIQTAMSRLRTDIEKVTDRAIVRTVPRRGYTIDIVDADHV